MPTPSAATTIPGQVFPRESMWRYRDYVVRAFNDDKPFDRFLVEQLYTLTRTYAGVFRTAAR
jgi:hypothetical protein